MGLDMKQKTFRNGGLLNGSSRNYTKKLRNRSDAIGQAGTD